MTTLAASFVREAKVNGGQTHTSHSTSGGKDTRLKYHEVSSTRNQSPVLLHACLVCYWMKLRSELSTAPSGCIGGVMEVGGQRPLNNTNQSERENNYDVDSSPSLRVIYH